MRSGDARRFAGIAAVGVLVLGLAGCGTTSPPPAQAPLTTPPQSSSPQPGTSSRTSGTTGTAATTVSIKGNSFSPAHLRVSTGQTVTWVNEDSVTHTVTAISGAKFDLEIPPGKTFSYPTDEADTITYKCSIHPGMLGDITITK